MRQAPNGHTAPRVDVTEPLPVAPLADGGYGVPVDLVPRMFDLFARGGNSDEGQAEPSGNGLGLAIAKQAVESVGGSLHYSSAEPRGARFTLQPPAASPPGATERPVGPEGSGR